MSRIAEMLREMQEQSLEAKIPQPYRRLVQCVVLALFATIEWLIRTRHTEPIDWVFFLLLVGIPAGVAWWVLFLALRSLKKNRG